MDLKCGCGHEFPEDLGAHGCPNCNGDEGPALPPRRGRVERQGDMGVIYIPMEDVHALRVALHPCACKAAKSHATIKIRDRLDAGLAKLEAMKS